MCVYVCGVCACMHVCLCACVYVWHAQTIVRVCVFVFAHNMLTFNTALRCHFFSTIYVMFVRVYTYVYIDIYMRVNIFLGSLILIMYSR